jgi:hypothetical protein
MRRRTICGPHFGACIFFFGLLVGMPVYGVQVTQNFDVDPGWTGLGNDSVGANLFGFSNTDNAGGPAGEAGGAISSRTEDVTYYADTNIGTLHDQQSLSAFGRLTAVGDLSPFNGGIEFGWFDATPPLDVEFGGVAVGSIFDAMAMRIIDNFPVVTTYRVQARLADEGGILITLQADTDYLFGMNYNPDGGGPGGGRLVVEIRRATDGSLVGTSTAARSSLGAPLNLTAFGFTSLDFDANFNAANFFVDSLQYSAAGTVALPGDYNSDGEVDGDDYLAWKGAFGNSIAPAGSGADGNGNGVVDAADYTVWRDNLASGGSAGLALSVPEPQSIAMLAFAIAFLFFPGRDFR